MKEPAKQITRRIKIPTSKVVGVVTEEFETKKAILRYEDDAIEVQKHILTQKMVNFIKKTGVDIEYIPETRLRGKTNIRGVSVKVTSLNRRSYDSGAEILVYEERETSWENTNKVLDALFNAGIDCTKECKIVQEDKSCMIKK